jgi:hypothetical protein
MTALNRCDMPRHRSHAIATASHAGGAEKQQIDLIPPSSVLRNRHCGLELNR